MRSATSAAMPDAAGRSRSATAASRWASVGLGSLLFVVSAAAILASHQVSAQINLAERTATASDLYQDARFYAAREDGALSAYRVDRTGAALAERSSASASLATTLAALQRSQGAAYPGSDNARVTTMIAIHQRSEAFAEHVIQLVDAGDAAAATTAEVTQLDPLFSQLAAELTTLEERHHAVATATLRRASREGALLRWGTPITLALALALIIGLSRVTRRHRRTTAHQALHDSLTGLPNRSLFVDRLEHLLGSARRSGAQPAVMTLDLDRFKDVNDTLGHHQGDELLIQAAARISALVRPSDTIARLGADEFGILLADGGTDAATNAAQRILAALEAPFCLNNVSVGIDASVGVAALPAIQPSADACAVEQAAELLRHADTAMHRAKADRCGFAHYDASNADANTTTHLALLGELRRALEHDELLLHYQPKVAADTGELLGVEALVRWQHPTRGLLGPGEFIALAEGTTLIHRLTTVVVDKALAFTRIELGLGSRLPVAVNVSARSLLDKGFAANVAERLAVHDVPAELLWIELTESTIMSDPDRAISTLAALRAIGVRLSIDDFGTGYSSMSYLRILPVDELKVDRSFVKGLTTNQGDAVLVQSAVDLGHNLGLSVVAEGVEDEATLVALRNLGVDVVQGYYLGLPMSDRLLREWMAERQRPGTVAAAVAPLVTE